MATRAGVLDLSDGGPLYDRAYRLLRDEIEAGTLRYDDLLPSERTLSEQLGVSRVTVRRALKELSDDGLIEADPPRGHRIRLRRLDEPMTGLISFTDMAAARGLTVTSRVLEARSRPATIDEAERLQLAPGRPIFELVRVRLLGGLPIAIDGNRISLDRLPGIETVDFTTASLYATLDERYGIVAVRADYAIEAVAADDAQADLLDVAAGAPLLQVDEITYDTRGGPVDTGRITYRGDRYRFRTRLTNSS